GAVGAPASTLGREPEQGDQAGAGLAVRDAIDQRWAPMPLERADDRGGRVVVASARRAVVAAPGPAVPPSVNTPPLLARPGPPGPAGGGRAARPRGRAQGAVPRLGQPLPGEQLARVLLARRSDVRMAKDARVGDGPAAADVGEERQHRVDLRVGKRTVAEFV